LTSRTTISVDLDVSLNGQRGGRGHGSQAVEIEVLVKIEAEQVRRLLEI